ncbi:MAG: dUTP diphosphatase [Firmicutes bacterium]|nr:dUTP diphosphatase [Bacillota bacterium]
MRRFEWVPSFVSDGLTLPQRQTTDAAGYDLAAGETVYIAPGGFALVRTGVRVQLEVGEFLALYARSSLALRRKLMLANGVGVIDRDYYENPDNGGEIMVALWNMGTSVAFIERGDRIAQAVMMPFLITEDDHPVKRHRHGGFGSTNASPIGR